MKWHLYCDGACSNNGATDALGGFGWALYKESDNELPIVTGCGRIQNATNNIAELMAVVHGCKEVSKMIPEIATVIVHLDSAYIYNCYAQRWWVKWMNNGWLSSTKKPVANKELWQLLCPYFCDSRFRWEKVAGHKGIKGNEIADNLAVTAKKSNMEFVTLEDLK